jgi:hypothetical protein
MAIHTVADLRAALKMLPGEAEVFLCHPDGIGDAPIKDILLAKDLSKPADMIDWLVPSFLEEKGISTHDVIGVLIR